MPTPTPEQQRVVSRVAAGGSVLVDAVPGSGKTTCVLALAAASGDRPVLQVTYNRALRDEVREKATSAGAHNLSVHTYHSLARAFFDRDTVDDTGVERSLAMQPSAPVPPFGVIVLDEAQDMTPLLYRFARLFASHVAASLGAYPTLAILGDSHQGVYGFKNADARFLTRADALWPECTFARLPMTTSFRLTRQIAGFVNGHMVGAPRITALREGPPVTYVCTRGVCAAREVLPEILKLLAAGARPSDMFVLTPSISETNPSFVSLENALVRCRVPVHVPNQEERTIDDSVTRGKLVFSTFHQAKGRERPIVVVLGLDAGFTKRFARGLPPWECPPPAYVAATRASERLVIAQSASCGPAAFMRRPRASSTGGAGAGCVAFVGERVTLPEAPLGFGGGCGPGPGPGPDPRNVITSPLRFSVTRLVRHLAYETHQSLERALQGCFAVERAAGEPVDLVTKVRTGPFTSEDVSELNAFALSAMWEHACHGGTTTLHRAVRAACARRATPILARHAESLKDPCETTADYLHLANVYRAVATRQHFKLRQIRSYNWLSAKQAEAVMRNYETVRPHADEFERMLAVPCYRFSRGVATVTGVVDVMGARAAWEVKCTSALSLEHRLQTAMYAWMWRKRFAAEHGARDFFLINVRTGETLRLDASSEALEGVADALACARLGGGEPAFEFPEAPEVPGVPQTTAQTAAQPPPTAAPARA